MHMKERERESVIEVNLKVKTINPLAVAAALMRPTAAECPLL